MKKGEKMIIDKIEDFCLKIAEKIGLKKLADWYREHREGMRYLVFGVLTTLLNLLIFTICCRIIKIQVVISNIISWIIAVLFAYVTNKLYVFDSKVIQKKELAREIISFFNARIVTLVIETVFLWATVIKLGLNEIIMKIIVNIIVIVLNFVFSKIFIFKEEKNRSI